jgi:origin recognition complex subunit 5
VTGRHLLEQTISDVHQSLSSNEDGNRAATRAYNTKCENLGSLAVHIQRLLADEKKFILVFDDIDQQRETPPTLIPALARLAENVSGSTCLIGIID